MQFRVDKDSPADRCHAIWGRSCMKRLTFEHSVGFLARRLPSHAVVEPLLLLLAPQNHRGPCHSHSLLGDLVGLSHDAFDAGPAPNHGRPTNDGIDDHGVWLHDCVLKYDRVDYSDTISYFCVRPNRDVRA